MECVTRAIPDEEPVARARWRHGRTIGKMPRMTARKLKVSLTISADVLALVDRDARRRHDTRSAVVEHWLRRAASASVEKEIEDATTAYYQSLRHDERAD